MTGCRTYKVHKNFCNYRIDIQQTLRRKLAGTDCVTMEKTDNLNIANCKTLCEPLLCILYIDYTYYIYIYKIHITIYIYI